MCSKVAVAGSNSKAADIQEPVDSTQGAVVDIGIGTGYSTWWVDIRHRLKEKLFSFVPYIQPGSPESHKRGPIELGSHLKIWQPQQ
ncbi:hypothetical protein SDC9_21700 [bioreactor metagenome]|uniref:Uncharacterized protein n=1 Tax=bioreactor metagenome TaxID=1076179 RepID=A0A644UAL6_9ZZZZ